MNTTNTELNIEDLYGKTTSAEQIKESFDRLTAPTGRYIFAATKVEPVRGSEDHPVPHLREREFAHVFGKLTNDTAKKFGHVGFDASWEIRRTEAGKLDKPGKLWGQIAVALDMKEKGVPEIIEAMRQYPLSVYVNESFKVPGEGKDEGRMVYRTARTEEDRKAYRSKGYESRNFVESVSRV